MIPLREQQLAWLDHIVQSSGLTITEIARMANLHPSSLTRFRNSDTDGHTLTAKTVKKIEDVTRVPAYESRLTPLLRVSHEEEAQPFTVGEHARNPIERAMKATEHSAGVQLWTLKSPTLSAIGYLPGMVLAVDEETSPRNGDAVLAEKYDFRRQTAETLFRIYRAPYLVTAQSQGEPDAPEVVDNHNVVIKGVIIGGFRLRA